MGSRAQRARGGSNRVRADSDGQGLARSGPARPRTGDSDRPADGTPPGPLAHGPPTGCLIRAAFRCDQR